MNLDRLIPLFEHSALIRLLRADQAPYLLAFLHETFKKQKRIEIEQEDFIAQLRNFQEDLAEMGREVLVRPAEEYLNEWVGETARYLRRFLAAEKDVWMIELQPETEEALLFIESVLERQDRSLGTDSRMQMIVEGVRELVLYAGGDPNAQLERLEQEKNRIEEKISALKSGGTGEALDRRQVVERFYLLLGMLRDLTGDFRNVEAQFRDIVSGMRSRERDTDLSTGDVLAYVLDAEDELKAHSHGASFYAFVKFVLSSKQRDDFDKMTAELAALADLESEGEGIDRLLGMIPLLTDEATKILSTTQRLSSALRRLLDPRASAEHQQFAHSLQSIMSLAARSRGAVPVSMEIDHSVSLDSPMSRDFWEPPSGFTPVEIDESISLASEKDRKKAAAEYAELKRLDWKSMQKKIDQALRIAPSVSLASLLAETSLRTGLVEVLGYLQLAADGGHLIDDSEPVELTLTLEQGKRHRVTMPHVLFTRPTASAS